jgi:hypothetical protein
MEPSRLGRGEMIAAVSGAALIIIMFLNWWSAPSVADVTGIAEQLGVETGDRTFNAWQASSFNDIIWFVTAVAAIGLGLLSATQTRMNLPVAASAIVTALGILSLILIVIRLIDPPYDLGREYGVWLGLIALLGITYGGWTAMQEEGTSFGEQARGVQDRVGGRDDEPPSSSPPTPPSQPPTGGGPNP